MKPKVAPKRAKEIMGELVKEGPKKDEATEVQFSGTATTSPPVSANRMKFSTSG